MNTSHLWWLSSKNSPERFKGDFDFLGRCKMQNSKHFSTFHTLRIPLFFHKWWNYSIFVHSRNPLPCYQSACNLLPYIVGIRTIDHSGTREIPTKLDILVQVPFGSWNPSPSLQYSTNWLIILWKMSHFSFNKNITWFDLLIESKFT